VLLSVLETVGTSFKYTVFAGWHPSLVFTLIQYTGCPNFRGSNAAKRMASPCASQRCLATKWRNCTYWSIVESQWRVQLLQCTESHILLTKEDKRRDITLH